MDIVDAIRYYENTPGGLVELTSGDNPFDGLETLIGTTIFPWRPDIGDIDNDGDMDVLLGLKDEYLIYFENTPGGFEPNAIDIGIDDVEFAYAIFCDLDRDCDEDLIVFDFSEKVVEVFALENTPNGFEYDYAMSQPFAQFNGPAADFQQMGMEIPNFSDGITIEELESLRNEINVHTEELNVMFDEEEFIFPYASCTDVNGDGDNDLVVVDFDFEDMEGEPEFLVIKYFERIGNQFVQVTGSQNPFEEYEVPLECNPIPFCNYPFTILGNLDGDGFLNLYTGLKDELVCDDTTVRQPPPCTPAIPTMSQWGIYILSLLLLVLGSVGLIRKREIILARRT